jgi:hypothetical protein
LKVVTLADGGNALNISLNVVNEEKKPKFFEPAAWE